MADNVVTVKRGGSYLTVPAMAVERYLAKGYDVVDESGKVVESSVPNDINLLKIAFKKHIKKIQELEAEIAQLKSKKQEPEKVVITEAPVKEPEVVEEKPKTTKRSRKN